MEISNYYHFSIVRKANRHVSLPGTNHLKFYGTVDHLVRDSDVAVMSGTGPRIKETAFTLSAF